MAASMALGTAELNALGGLGTSSIWARIRAKAPSASKSLRPVSIS